MKYKFSTTINGHPNGSYELSDYEQLSKWREQLLTAGKASNIKIECSEIITIDEALEEAPIPD